MFNYGDKVLLSTRDDSVFDGKTGTVIPSHPLPEGENETWVVLDDLYGGSYGFPFYPGELEKVEV